jgi:hypothetical protein
MSQIDQLLNDINKSADGWQINLIPNNGSGECNEPRNHNGQTLNGQTLNGQTLNDHNIIIKH